MSKSNGPPYAFAVLRAVPHVHIGNFVNVGVIVHSPVADFLDIQVPQDLWPRLVEAAHIDTMRRQGATLMPEVVNMFSKGSDTFFYKGVNGRWRDVAATEDLAIYDAKVKSHFSQACAKWLERGRGEGSDPRHSAN